MAAGDAQRRPADLHVRSGNLAGVDGVAQVHIDVAARAHVAHRRESCHQRSAGIHHAVDGLFRIGRRQFAVGVEIGIHRDMRVHIDEPRKHRHAAQIDDRVARLRGSPRHVGAID